ncbi:transposase [Shewanella sp. 10N.286.52.B9]|nr:transposase [Shewanella sp. 10N.286.52.B9]
MKPAERKVLAHYAINEFGLGVVLACDALSISRCTFYYQLKRIDDNDIIEAVSGITEKHRAYGFRKIFKRLRLLGHQWNHKRVYRVYCGLKLNLRRKGKKRLPSREPEPLAVPVKANDCWSMDFMSDNLFSGKSFRTFNVIDDYHREALAIEVDSSLPAQRVIRVLDRIAAYRGYPKRLRQDNGPEFISHALEIWAEQHGIKLDFIKPGKPTQNAFIERFNRTYRNEVLDCYLFNSLTEVREITDSWLEEYNYDRPHELLNNLPPKLYERLNKENSLKI